jgi:translation initiation factor IF-1
MPPPDIRIPSPATIGEVFSQRHYHATLPNGKIILAHYPTHRLGPLLKVGDIVRVEFALTEFSEGEIIEPCATTSS